MNGLVSEITTVQLVLLGVGVLLGTAIAVVVRRLHRRITWSSQRTAVARPPRAFGDGGCQRQGLRTDGGTDSGIEMVVAYIRPDRLGDVKKSLAEVGAPSLTVTNVTGRGSQPPKKGQWRGEAYSVDLHKKAKIECVVADVPTEDVVEAIAEAAKTGEPGDGKIFVVPVTGAVQIRTGKRGTEAV